MGIRIPFDTREQGTLNQSNDEIVLPTSAWEAMKASFTMAREFDSVGSLIARRAALNENDDGALKPPQELNERYKDEGLDKPFSEPMTLETAETIVEDHRQRRKLEDKVATTSGIGKVGAFVAGFAGQMTDPVDFAANILTGRAITSGLGRLGTLRVGARIAERLPNAAKAGAAISKVTPAAAKTVAQGAAAGFTEGAIGAAVIEPLSAHVNQEYLHDYTLGQALTNIVYGGGMGSIGGAVGSLMGRGRNRQMHLDAEDTAIAQATNGNRVDVDPMLHQIVREMNEAVDRANDVPVPLASSHRGVEWHAYTPRNHQGFENAVGRVIDDDLGDLVYFSDRPAVANGHSTSSLSGELGAIHSVELPTNARLLDLDLPPSEALKAAAEAAIGRKAKWLDQVPSGKVLLQRVRQDAAYNGKNPREAMAAVNQTMRSAGFQGYEHTAKQTMGFENKPHRVVAVFDRSQAKLLRSSESNPGLLSPADVPAQVKAAEASRETGLLTTPDDVARASVIRQVDPPDEAQIAQKLTELEEEIKGLDEQGQLDPSVKKKFEALKELKAKGGIEDQAYKHAFFCLTKGS